MKKPILTFLGLLLSPLLFAQLQSYDVRGNSDYNDAPRDVRFGPYTSIGSTRAGNFGYIGFNAFLNSSGYNSGYFNNFKPNWAGNGTTKGNGIIMQMRGGGYGDLNFMGIDWNNDWSEKDLTAFSPIMSLRHNQRVGIGNDNPQATLDVTGTTTISGLTTLNNSLNISSNGYTTINNPLTLNNNQLKLNTTHAVSVLMTNETASQGIGTHSNTFRIVSDYDGDGNGNISHEIGGVGNVITQLTASKYTIKVKTVVEGDIESRKVKVSQDPGDWPDYVFEPNYELGTLNSLEQYIKAHKHLPEVPSANEVGKNGLDLGSMDATLLRKIEELTLHLIEQNKKQTALEKSMQSQANQIQKLLEMNQQLLKEINALKNDK